MKDDSWTKVKDILADALEIEPLKRQHYLASLDISPEIRTEVESLIAFEDEAAKLMNLPAVQLSSEFFGDVNSQSVLTGKSIGSYTIVRELGYGGMGSVYLARRSDGKFEQKVALKLLKRELNTAALRRRFDHERRILASLEHPNIARLLDVGTTDDGIPFFAMEYVEGLPIHHYCEHNGLELNERLDLFREVCAAVNFAHRNLVVHRDLKPSNILVNTDGIPKLLDFGISKIISDEYQQGATVTQLGAMTPSYASPEQLQNESTTTATDIYSLGVVLYELLSGHRPFESQEDDLKKIYRAVIETDPSFPSAVVDTLARSPTLRSVVDSPVHTASNRSETTVSRLSGVDPQDLKGDLDNIVLKAMKKEPDRRYSSAENFAEDIRRHQQGLTVTARPDVFSYRAEKFVRRNRVMVTSAAVVLLAIVAGVGATLWQAQVAAAERDRARLEAEKSKKISEYLTNVLNFSNADWRSSNPDRSRKATVAEAVDEALKTVATDLADEPEMQADILTVIGQTYVGQARFVEAETVLRQAIEKFDQVSGKPNTKSLKATALLADSLYLGGKFDESEQLFVEVIDYFRPRVDEDPTLLKWIIVPLNSLGNVYVFQGKFKEAELLIRESTEYAAKTTGKERSVVPVMMANYGAILFNTGQFDTSLVYLNKAYAEMKTLGNEQKYEAGQCLNLIGRSYVLTQDYAAADTNLRKGREIILNTVGEKNTYFIQNLYYSAMNLNNQGKYGEALAEIAKLNAVASEMYPNGHVQVGNAQRIQGEIYTKTNRVKDGEENLRAALAYVLTKVKEPNPQVSQAKTALAENLTIQNKNVEAAELLTSALDGYLKTSGEDHPFTKHCRELLSVSTK